MFQRLDDVEKRYEELNGLISDPEVISRQNEWKKLMKIGRASCRERV